MLIHLNPHIKFPPRQAKNIWKIWQSLETTDNVFDPCDLEIHDDRLKIINLCIILEVIYTKFEVDSGKKTLAGIKWVFD